MSVETLAQQLRTVRAQVTILQQRATTIVPEQRSELAQDLGAVEAALGNIEALVGNLRDPSLADACPAPVVNQDQAFLNILMDSIPDGIYFKDKAGRFLKINRGQARNLGIEHEADALGKTDYDFFSAEHAEEAWRDEQQILATGEPMLDRLEHYLGTDGKTVWVSATKVPMLDSAGKPFGIVGISRDMTDRMEVEVALQREREFLKTLLSNLAEGIVACDQDGGLTLFNEAALAFHGFSTAPADVTRWVESGKLYYPDGITMVRLEDLPLWRALNGEAVHDVELRVIPQTGVAHAIVFNGSALFDGAGNKLGAVVVMHDITERQRAEAALRAAKDELEMRVADRTAALRLANEQLQQELAERQKIEHALRESEIRFRTLVEQSPLSTQILGPDGRTRLVNRAWEELWGVTLEQIPEYNILTDPQLIAKGVAPYIQRAFAGEAVEIPAIMYDPNATLPDRTRHLDPLRWVRACIYPVKDAAGRVQEVVLVHDDISEQVRSQVQLEESERKFRQLAEHINEVFWIMDVSTFAMLYVSPAYEQIWGRTCASLYAEPRSFLETVHPEDYPMVETALERQLAGQQTVMEYRVVQPNGTIRWVRDRGFPIRNGTGQVYRVAGIAEDITERKHVDAALRESEERYRRLVELSPETIGVHSAGTIVYINAAGVQLLGATSADELIGRPMLSFVHPDYRDAVLERSRQTHHEQAEVALLEEKFVRLDGQVIDVEVAAIPISYGGKPAAQVVVRDITARKRAEQALHFQKTLLEAQSEASLDGILVVSAAGDILSYNRRFIELWKIPDAVIASGSDEQALAAVREQLVDPDEFLARVAYLYANPDLESREYIELKDGRTFDRYSTPIRSSDGIRYGRVWFFRDVTERRQAEAERTRLLRREQAARAEAEAAIVVRDEFLSIAAHELKTPLTSLLGYAEMLMRRVTLGRTVTERDQRAAQVITEQARRLSRLIRTLLDISRIQLGHFTLEYQSVDIRVLVQRVVEEVQPSLQQHTLDATWPDMPLIVEGDELLLEQTLQNLLGNAVKYSPNGGQISVSVQRVADQACIAVSDQGMGIPAEAHTQLFQRFYRAPNSSSSHISGMGLGLYIVKEIVNRHGGVIEVHSTEGEGSTFIIWLPLAAS